MWPYGYIYMRRGRQETDQHHEEDEATIPGDEDDDRGTTASREVDEEGSGAAEVGRRLSAPFPVSCGSNSPCEAAQVKASLTRQHTKKYI